MKKYLAYYLILLFLIKTDWAFCQYKGQHYTIMIQNNCFFDLKAEGVVEKGQGIFHPYTAIVKKGQSFEYRCENDNAFKGVEGHLKFTADGGEVYGLVDIYFDNPAVGSVKFNIENNGPFTVNHIVPPASKRDPNLWIAIGIDTSGGKNVNPFPTGGISTGGKDNPLEPIPPVINFEWEVIQRMPKEEDDENDGKAYKEVKYFFTANGDYAAIKPEDKSFSLMVYSKKGNTWLFDEEKKVITVMNMPKTVGEGGQLGKSIAEGISKAPLTKHKTEEFIITRTGKTKTILQYKAEEFQVVPASQNSSNKNSGAISLWYVTTPFDPIKIYTMGVGRPADLTKLQNDPKMKNNMAAIPLLNKNFLLAESDFGGKVGMETLAIKHVNNTIYTAGYKIKTLHSLKDLFKDDDKDN